MDESSVFRALHPTSVMNTIAANRNFKELIPNTISHPVLIDSTDQVASESADLVIILSTNLYKTLGLELPITLLFSEHGII